MLFFVFWPFCEPALTFPKTIDKPSMSMVSHKTIHSMAMVRLEKTIGKTIDTNVLEIFGPPLAHGDPAPLGPDRA